MHAKIHVLLGIVCFLLSFGHAASVDARDLGDGGVTKIGDTYRVPHVFGSTEVSLWYGVGYAVAQDCLWQAEILHRTAKGTRAELFGPGALNGDIQVRALFDEDVGRMDHPDTSNTFAWIERLRTDLRS